MPASADALRPQPHVQVQNLEIGEPILCDFLANKHPAFCEAYARCRKEQTDTVLAHPDPKEAL